MRFKTIQITFLITLSLTACIPITIRPGAMGPVRDWPATANCPVPARTASDAPKLVTLMNIERAKVGLEPLVLSDAISAVSHAYACEISARQDIGHVGTDGSKVSERLRRGGITASMVAENNASFYRTPEEAMVAWMASPHHRDNILRRDARKVGIGQAGEGLWAVWVVNFTS
jgi:uncharacterized protein YkwD